MTTTEFKNFSMSNREPTVGDSMTHACIRFLQGILMTLICLPLAMTAQAADQAQANQLRDLSVISLPGDQVQITLTLANPAPTPVSFTIDNPARIALDFPHTQNKLADRSRNIGVGVVKSVNAVEARGRTRVVLNLAQMVPYQTRVSGNKVYLTLDSVGASAAASAAAAAGGASNTIKNVDFRRGEHGEGRVIFNMSNPAAAVDMHQEGDNIVVEFFNATVPDKLQRRLDVLDFATPVKTIDTTQQGKNVRVIIHPTGADHDQLAYQSDDVYTVEVKPVTKKEKEEDQKKKFGYTGERLSLNFQNIEVRAVLQLLADFTGLNMVVSDSVRGNVTLRLKNVPWDQALAIILKTKGLAMRRTGNVILVAPSQELAAREKLELEAKQQIEELAPLRTEWFQINYAKAADLAKLIKAPQNSLLSKRGNVTLDDRTNTLMVQDTSAQLDAIRRLISRLDIPVRQVLIESRIVIASDDFTKDLGVRFGLSKFTNFSNNSVLYAGGGGISGSSPSTSTSDLIVDLPAAPTTGTAATFGLAIGRLGNHMLQLELSAMQAEGRGEIISSPRVITANQKPALIEQGVEIPYQEASSSGATTVSFKKAVLSLQVTPQITPDDRVIMDLEIKKDEADFTRAVLGVPPLNTRKITTQVLVSNGETIVLGGVYEHTKQAQTNRVPFFGDLPLVGALFRNKHDTDSKSELLVFITPKIIKEGLATKP